MPKSKQHPRICEITDSEFEQYLRKFGISDECGLFQARAETLLELVEMFAHQEDVTMIECVKSLKSPDWDLHSPEKRAGFADAKKYAWKKMAKKMTTRKYA